MSENTVLVVRKPDRTIHIVPVDQKAFYQAQNNRLERHARFGLEEMDEDKARSLGFYDKDFKTGVAASTEIKAKDARIAELEALLAAKSGDKKESKETAVEKIARINAAQSPEEVIEILGDDFRETVKAAADKKFASFQ